MEITTENLYMARVIRLADERIYYDQKYSTNKFKPSKWVKFRKYYIKMYLAEQQIKPPKPLKFRQRAFADPFVKMRVKDLKRGATINLKAHKRVKFLESNKLLYRKPEPHYRLTFTDGTSLILRGNYTLTISTPKRSLSDAELGHKNKIRTYTKRQKLLVRQQRIDAYKQKLADEQIEYLLENNLDWDYNTVSSHYGIYDEFDYMSRSRHEPIPQFWGLYFQRGILDWDGKTIYHAKQTGNKELVDRLYVKRAAKIEKRRAHRRELWKKSGLKEFWNKKKV